MPPEEKPEGNRAGSAVTRAWDDERKDYLWVSGVWRRRRRAAVGAGYWREDGEQSQWVPGFWTEAAGGGREAEVTYLPAARHRPRRAAGHGAAHRR